MPFSHEYLIFFFLDQLNELNYGFSCCFPLFDCFAIPEHLNFMHLYKLNLILHTLPLPHKVSGHQSKGNYLFTFVSQGTPFYE